MPTSISQEPIFQSVGDNGPTQQSADDDLNVSRFIVNFNPIKTKLNPFCVVNCRDLMNAKWDSR